MTRAKNTQSSLRTFYDGDSHTKQQMYNAKKFMNKKKLKLGQHELLQIVQFKYVSRSLKLVNCCLPANLTTVTLQIRDP